ncbi:acyltransferase family protein [Microbacterium sp. SLBN-111]|uniref:acyltransferase family protein n=1 Tax=Microbacterium sp. SLBN-111 TaxID=3377733 RepID=UPI003C78B564
MLYHAGVPFLPGGYVGVDIFFVISGFLITSHLLGGLARTGRVPFASFYAKRARRILPASLLVVVLSVLAALIWFPPLLMEEVWRGAVATALYVPNLLFAANGTNYLAETTPSVFQHYWSLGIEEQFYLIWPLLLALGWKHLRSRRALGVALAVIVALSFLACVVLTFRLQPWAFFSLPTRAWELGAGGIVAFALHHRAQVLGPRSAAILGWAGLLGLLSTVVLFTSSTPFPGYWAALPVITTALVILAGATPTRYGPSALLSLRGMAFVGAISYSLYLVHWPALVIPQAAVGYAHPLPLWITLLIAAACVPIAWALYRYVENPARSWRVLVDARPRRTLLAALAGSLAAILVATGASVAADSRDLFTPRTAAASALTTPPAFTSFVPANLRPALRDASSDQPRIYADGCHRSFADTAPADCVYGDRSAPRVVLFGDSHAAQWFPALMGWADQNGYAVEVHTKSSCPSIDATVFRDGVPYTECSTWRDAVIDRIDRESPALVLIANFGTANLNLPANRGYADAWAAALSSTLTRISAPTAVIADTPDLGQTPSICLSARLDDTAACGLPRTEAVRADVRRAEAEAADANGSPVIDLTDYLCSDVCNPVIGDTLVYRDAHHLTATFSAELAGPLGAALARVMTPPAGP